MAAIGRAEKERESKQSDINYYKINKLNKNFLFKLVDDLKSLIQNYRELNVEIKVKKDNNKILIREILLILSEDTILEYLLGKLLRIV